MAQASWLRQPRPKFSDLDPDLGLVRFDSNRFGLQYWNSTRALNLISRFKLFPRNHLQGGKRVEFLFAFGICCCSQSENASGIARSPAHQCQGSREYWFSLWVSAEFDLFFSFFLSSSDWLVLRSCRCMWIYVAFRSYRCLVFHIVVWSSGQDLSFALEIDLGIKYWSGSRVQRF